MNYSHQIAEKFVMSENKVVLVGGRGQISTPFIGGHRGGGSCVKVGVQTGQHQIVELKNLGTLLLIPKPTLNVIN